MKNLPRCFNFCIYGATLLLLFTETVRGQCVTCEWSNDNSAVLKWVSKTEEGESFIHVEKCEPRNCGLGIIQSPWLSPTSSPTRLDLQFKVYGYSSVYLKLYLKEEGIGGQPKLLFTKSANYGDPFPAKWSSGKVTIPVTKSRFQLMLKASIPFKEAFVAVKGIDLLESTSTASTTSTTTRRPTQAMSTSSTTTRETNSLEFPDDENEDNSDISQALEDGKFVGVEELILGHTTVVNPNLCRYN